jgi:hypothetical protein
MPKVVFEADTHPQLVAQVKRWLASAQAGPEGQLSVAQAIEQGAELTRDALRVIAAAAPRPVVDHDVVRTGGTVLKTMGEKGRSAVFEVNVIIARQILKQLHGV